MITLARAYQQPDPNSGPFVGLKIQIIATTKHPMILPGAPMDGHIALTDIARDMTPTGLNHLPKRSFEVPNFLLDVKLKLAIVQIILAAPSKDIYTVIGYNSTMESRREGPLRRAIMGSEFHFIPSQIAVVKDRDCTALVGTEPADIVRFIF